MRYALVFLILMIAGPAWADVVATNGRDTVRLSDKACTIPEVLAQFKPQHHTLLRAASATVRLTAGPQHFDACWFIDGQFAHLMYPDGDQGLIPLADFKEAPGV